MGGWSELHCHTPYSFRHAGSSIAALVERAAMLGMPALAITDTMTLAGAFDGAGIPRRRLLWLLGERWGMWTSGRTVRKARKKAALPVAQAVLPWVWADERAEEAPLLPPLTLEQEVELDVATQGMSVRPHPITFLRARLSGSSILPIAKLKAVEAGQKVMIVGKVISAQRPPTAKGMGFLVLEDETGRVQVALLPKVAETLYRALAESRVLLVAGLIERAGQQGQHVSLLTRSLRAVLPDAWHEAKADTRSEDRQRKQMSARLA